MDIAVQECSVEGTAPLQLSVLNVARGVAGAYATRLLADLGANCETWRWTEPGSGEWPRHDVLFRQYFEHGVATTDRMVSLVELIQVLPAVVGKYDLLISDFSAGEVPEQVLWGALCPYNPAIVAANVDHFGRHGRCAGWQGDEFTDYAMGGYWSLGGDPEREPLRVPGRQAQFHAGMQLTLAALAAVRHARLTGDGQEVEVSAVEAMLGAHWSTTVAWTHEGRILKRAGCDLVRAKDGWVFFFAFMFENMLVLIDRPDLLDDERFNSQLVLYTNREALKELVTAWAATQPVDAIVNAAQELRIPTTAVRDAETLLSDAQLVSRRYFREIAGAKLPGLPFKWTDPWLASAPKQRLAAALDERPAVMGPSHPSEPARSGMSGPLTGLHVVEVTNNWAGPIAGRHLGDLGAEVIKVELATKPATRVSHYPGTEPGKYHWNRSGYFNEMNRNKRDVCLDLSTARGRQLFLELVRWSDVLVENNSARVMPNLGLGYEALSEVNPRLVMVSISGFGASGPKRDWVAYGSNIEAACGLAAMTGYDDTTPFRTGSFIADPIAGGHAVVAALAALERRDRTGTGTHIDIALTESALPFMLEAFTYYAANGRVMPRRGNVDPDDAPTGAYRCAGNDDWVAIAVRTDAQWRDLCDIAQLGCDPNWKVSERLGHRSEIDAALQSWTETASQQEVPRLLQARGIPAAPILHNWQLHSDAHLCSRKAFISIEHPDTGVLPYPGFPWHFSLTEPSVRCAAPRFGEANAYVFQRLLGLDSTEVQQLYEEGITAAEPVGLRAVSV